MTKVIIIGAGIVGATIAYELSKIKDLEITLIEQQEPASGCTNAALGILMGVISQKQKGRGWRRRSLSIQRYHRLIPELETLTGEEIPWNKQGIVRLRFVGEDIQKWEKLTQIRQQQGWNLELWDRQKLQDYCPQIDHENIDGAIYSLQDIQIDPVALTKALVTGATLNGVKSYFGCKVQNLNYTHSNDVHKHHCCQVHTTDGEFNCDQVVIAAGLGSTPLTNSLQQTVDIRPVIGQGLQVKLTQALGNPDFQPVITGDDVHIAPLGEGEYWLGATVEFADENGEVIAKPALLEEVKEKAISFCPGLAQGEIMRTWMGKRPRPEGQPAPIIGKLAGYDNVFLATGHYRNGVLLAPVTAQEIAELI